jgi:hypothetical protein
MSVCLLEIWFFCSLFLSRLFFLQKKKQAFFLYILKKRSLLLIVFVYLFVFILFVLNIKNINIYIYVYLFICLSYFSIYINWHWWYISSFSSLYFLLQRAYTSVSTSTLTDQTKQIIWKKINNLLYSLISNRIYFFYFYWSYIMRFSLKALTRVTGLLQYIFFKYNFD